MSGGGGGSGGSGGDGGAGPVDGGTPCDRLRFETQLASPVRTVVSALAPGQVLDLAIQGHAVAALVRGAGGAVAGFIVERLPELLRCLQAGHAFEAEVLSVQGGAVRVRVEPV